MIRYRSHRAALAAALCLLAAPLAAQVERLPPIGPARPGRLPPTDWPLLACPAVQATLLDKPAVAPNVSTDRSRPTRAC